jgi:hypothetical protein
MKLNFKKIASVLTSTVMLSSTIGLAAAANYPAPFVKGGVADVAVVWGSAAAASDLVAVTDITADLQAELAVQTASSDSTSSTATVEGGDYVVLEKSNNKFNLGDDPTDFYSKLTSDELSVVLADGTYWSNMNEDYDYTQEITLSSDPVLEFFQDNDFNDDKPVIGFNLDSGDELLSYTLEFETAAEGGTDWEDLLSTTLDMLGRTFFVSEVETTTDGIKMTLLDAANTATIKESETKTVTVNDKTYDVSVEVVTTNDKVKLNINGETTPSLVAGQTFPLKDGSFVGVTDVSYSEKKDSIVEFSIGTGQIVLTNGEEVQINDDDVSELEDANGYSSKITAAFVNTTTDINSLTLTWELADDAWVTKGTELVMPGFNTIKLSMGDFLTAKQEITTVNDDNDVATVSTTVKDGEVDIPLLYLNAGDTAFAGIGASSNEPLVTNSSGGAVSSVTLVGEGDAMFVATWIYGDEAQSYVYQLSSVNYDSGSGKTKVVLNNLAGGADLTFNELTDDETPGEMKLTLVAGNETTETAAIKVEPSGSGSVYTDRVVTKEGLWFHLPVAATNTSTTDGAWNSTVHSTSWTMNLTEENEDDEVAGGPDFQAVLGVDSTDKGTQVSSLAGIDTYPTEDNSDIDVGYVTSELATKATLDKSGDLNELELEYHGSEAYADVVLSEVSASITSEGGVTSTGTVKRLGSVAVSDAEAASVSGKNLIVVGGSCVNSVAAQLLGGALCGADFQAKTKAGAGSFVIETFSQSSGKVATLVAGYNAADTTNAAKYFTTQPVDTTAGKTYVGTSATSATLQTTETA